MALLITGATGHVGLAVVKLAVEAGLGQEPVDLHTPAVEHLLETSLATTRGSSPRSRLLAPVGVKLRAASGRPIEISVEARYRDESDLLCRR